MCWLVPRYFAGSSSYTSKFSVSSLVCLKYETGLIWLGLSFVSLKSFSFLIVLVKDSDCTENNEKSGHSCLIPAVRESAFHLSLGGMLVTGLLNADFIMSNYVCSIAGASRDFYPIETLNLGKAPPMSVVMIVKFVCLIWFGQCASCCVKLHFHLWNKADLDYNAWFFFFYCVVKFCF